MQAYKRLLLANRAWAQERISLKPTFFQQLLHDDPAEFLWIGCAEAVVPPDEIVATGVGDMVVHRNFANLAVPGDPNFDACLRHAVEEVGIHHVVVCGHYGCRGVRAAIQTPPGRTPEPWLSSVTALYEQHRGELDLHSDHQMRCRRMIELNVMRQVQNLATHPTIRAAWEASEWPYLHGWVFDEGTGGLERLVKVEPGTEVSSA